MGFAGQTQRKEAKGDEFLKVFVQNSFFNWSFLKDLNEERPEDETIVRCRAGLRELRGADCATEDGTGPRGREMLLCCAALSSYGLRLCFMHVASLYHKEVLVVVL